MELTCLLTNECNRFPDADWVLFLRYLLHSCQERELYPVKHQTTVYTTLPRLYVRKNGHDSVPVPVFPCRSTVRFRTLRTQLTVLRSYNEYGT